MDKKAARKKLLSRTVKVNGCWEWQGAKSGGYGCINIEGQNWWTHRLSYFLHNGELPDGRYVCHQCDNPPCCNPRHLFIGSSQDNTADRHAKGRDAKGERSGNAKLTDVQVRRIRLKYDGKPGRIKQLAERYGVSSDQIRNILRGKQRLDGSGRIWWKAQRCGPRAMLLKEGDRFGCLVVVNPNAKKIGNTSASLCRCICGNESRYQNTDLRGGRKTSCRRCERLNL